MASDTKRGSLSRLSPLARPFTLSKRNNSSFSPSSSALDRSFSSFSLEGDSFAYYPQYPSGVLQGSADFGLSTESKSDFDAVPVTKSTELGYEAHKGGDLRAILHWKDKHGGFSMFNDDSTKQAGSPAEGLKLSPETSDSLRGKLSGISLKDHEVRPKRTREIDSQCVPISSEFSTTSDLNSSAILQDPQSGINYLPPSVSWSSCETNIAYFGRSLSQQRDFHAAKQNVPPSSDINSLSALVSEPSVASTCYLPFNHVLSENLDSDGDGRVSKNNFLGYGQASLKKPHAIVDKSKEVYHNKVLTDKGKEGKPVTPEVMEPVPMAKSELQITYSSPPIDLTLEVDKSKEVFHHNVLADKGKEGKLGKPVTHEVMEPVPMAKSELQITCPSLLIDLTPESLGIKESDPIENSSKIINENDSDLDSPCWKGKLAAEQSSCEVSAPDNLQYLKSEQEACSYLNPLAPHFFPSSDKQKVNYCGNEGDGNDCFSFQKTASSVVSLFSREQRLQHSATAGSSSSEQSSITEAHCYSDMHVPNKEYELLTDSSCSSMHGSSCVVLPSVMEDYMTSSGQLLTGQCVGGFGKAITDTVPNGSTSVSLFASKHVFDSSSCREGVSTDLSETYGGAAKPLYSPPRLDFRIVVKTMNELSELLMQNCTNDLDSLNEHEHDIIKRIIHNLTLCIRNRVGEHTLMSESSHPHTSYCVRKSTHLNKCSNMELQTTRTKAVMVSHELGHQNKHERQMSSASFRERFLDSLNSRNGGFNKNEHITQVNEKGLEGHYELEEEENPQVLFYKNLWLEAEAALCSMKYKVSVLGLKTEMEKIKMAIR
ncbi:PREDICTED: uncharacterized protein LOC105135048 isoform X4 [Populus euphratica]|uniref:Uncharacterized protein LOC105135048 isoform X4 n=1 Tax=Populus euphratica TaxID=75702 RepID=A0AAJ6Y0M2_POPEU|nr:PREDICTED: uncharacterized protein LOC105135048 isoform X4 [Populus euphratica]